MYNVRMVQDYIKDLDFVNIALAKVTCDMKNN